MTDHAMPDAKSDDATRCINCGGTPLKVKKRRLCDPCYCRWQKYGDPNGGGPRLGMSPLERFNYYVPDQADPSSCWIWTGPTLGREVCDYGRIYMGDDADQRLALAHRWSYEHFIGPIPEDKEIDHVKDRGCTSTLCVNPAHLEPVPHKINVLRGDAPSAKHARKECCPKCGGPYTEYDGRRGCRPCANATMRRWKLETGRTAKPRTGSA